MNFIFALFVIDHFIFALFVIANIQHYTFSSSYILYFIFFLIQKQYKAVSKLNKLLFFH